MNKSSTKKAAKSVSRPHCQIPSKRYYFSTIYPKMGDRCEVNIFDNKDFASEDITLTDTPIYVYECRLIEIIKPGKPEIQKVNS